MIISQDTTIQHRPRVQTGDIIPHDRARDDRAASLTVMYHLAMIVTVFARKGIHGCKY